MLLNRLEDVEHARLRAQVQVVLDEKTGVEAFEDYMRIAFPYLESRKKRQQEEARNALAAWIKQGPLRVTPTVMPTRGSKMVRQIQAAQAKGRTR